MSTASWSSFLQWVAPWVPGVPDPVLEDAIRTAAIDFCRRSRTWRVELSPLSVVALTYQYAIASALPGTVTAADVVVSDIIRMEFNGLDLPVKTPDQLDDAWPGWKIAQAYQPSVCFMSDERTLRLVAIPTLDAAAAIAGTVALKPSATAATIDQTVFEEHHQAIANGALSKLLLMPGNSWTSREDAVDRRTAFDKAVWSARNRARKAYTATRAFAARPREYGYG